MPFTVFVSTAAPAAACISLLFTPYPQDPSRWERIGCPGSRLRGLPSDREAGPQWRSGGIPFALPDGGVAGALGVSGPTVDNDEAVAEAATEVNVR